MLKSPWDEEQNDPRWKLAQNLVSRNGNYVSKYVTAFSPFKYFFEKIIV